MAWHCKCYFQWNFTGCYPIVVEFDTGHNFTEDAPDNHVGININNINSIQQIQYSSMAPKKFRLRDLTKATYGFSLENKLGQGGFGTMYKGLLDVKLYINLIFGSCNLKNNFNIKILM